MKMEEKSKKEKFNRVIVKNLSKDFKIGFKKNQNFLQRVVSVFSGREPKRILKALKEVSFNIECGEIIGIIGENGSGKSTLLRIIAGIYKKDKGIVQTKGNIIPLISLKAALRDRLVMKDNIYFLGSLLGLSQKEIREKFNMIVDFAGLEKFVKTKIYQFSDGMKQRLAFSIAIHCNPEILLFDEVFAGGDEDFRNKSSDAIKKLLKKGCSALLVSHNLDLIKSNCNRTIWMEKGEIIKQGDSEKVIKEYIKKIRKIKQMQDKRLNKK